MGEDGEGEGGCEVDQRRDPDRDEHEMVSSMTPVEAHGGRT
jgi:hypothetical protein